MLLKTHRRLSQARLANQSKMSDKKDIEPGYGQDEKPPYTERRRSSLHEEIFDERYEQTQRGLKSRYSKLDPTIASLKSRLTS